MGEVLLSRACTTVKPCAGEQDYQPSRAYLLPLHEIPALLFPHEYFLALPRAKTPLYECGLAGESRNRVPPGRLFLHHAFDVALTINCRNIRLGLNARHTYETTL